MDGWRHHRDQSTRCILRIWMTLTLVVQVNDRKLGGEFQVYWYIKMMGSCDQGSWSI